VTTAEWPMPRAPRPRVSLRRLLIGGALSMVIVAGVVTVISVTYLVSLQRDADRDVRAGVLEQQTADQIIAAVYGQIMASYRQLQMPSAANMERFDSLGSTAFDHLRGYLFQDMSMAARRQVEAIRELHQSLEVDAYDAFEQAKGGRQASARAGIVKLELRANELELAVDHFMDLRNRDREVRREHQAAVRWRVLVGVAMITVSLIIVALLFIRLMQRHVVNPLEQLQSAAMEFGKGNLAARVPKQRHEEINNVSLSFNEMAARMQRAHRQIERQNVELSGALAGLKDAQQELVQQEKLSAIGLMLAGLAHELNNPLAGILGAAQCLRSELGEHADPAVRGLGGDLVDPLVTLARRAGDLVRNLLLFSRKSTDERDTVNVKAALGVAVGLRGYAFAQAGKDLVLEIADDLYVEVEAQRFEHVAMNLMTNALDAMVSAGGTRLLVRGVAAGDRVVLSFDDDGPGFTEPDRIFDPFYTTKPVGTGTGLGLTLVHRFVTEVDGTIVAGRSPSGGASITITLRAVVAPPTFSMVTGEHRAASAIARGLSSPGRARVLVVDDEPALREVQRRILTRLGHTVTLACDGAQAVAAMEADDFEIVITDIRMPGALDGVGVYRWIEAHRPGLADRCLFITGDIVHSLAGGSLDIPPERVLAKPFDVSDYQALVTDLLADTVTTG
jgi:C4-dicarboxylate-specific signal transduction histidine kinase/ActR/RegA family two-component response regulator